MKNINTMKIVKTVLAIAGIGLGCAELCVNSKAQDYEIQIAVDEYMKNLRAQEEVKGEAVDTDFEEVISDDEPEEETEE